MLKIDCLVKNTDFIDGVKKYVKYIGNEHAEDGKDASFEGVYNRLKKEKLEVDIETAGVLYMSEFSDRNDETFTSRDEVEKIAGREFDETTKNLLLGKPKEGEQIIGNLPPRKAIAKRIADAFNNNVVVDERTKSILKNIEDTYMSTFKKFLGELPNKTATDTRTFEQMFEQSLDKIALGYRDSDTGELKNLSTLHEEVKKEFQALTDKLENEGDPIKAEQWKRHMDDFQDSVYSLALTAKEEKAAVDGALKAAGFEKTNKDGTTSLDWDKLATSNNSVEQLRNHVIEALTDSKTGKFDKPTAEKIANSLQKEFLEKLSKMVDINDKEQQKLSDSYTPTGRKPNIKIDDIVAEQVKNWQNYIGYKDREGKPLVISKKTAADALKHTIIEAGISKKIGKTGKETVDINKLSDQITNKSDIKKIAQDYFENQKNNDGTQKYDAATVEKLSDAIDGMYTDMFNKVREHVEGKKQAIENTWNNPTGQKTPVTLSDVVSKRLKEWSQYKKITGSNSDLKFTKNEAQRITGEILKNSEQYGKETQSGEKQINWKELAIKTPTPDAMIGLIESHLKDKEGYSDSDATVVAHSITKDYHQLLADDIKTHGQSILDAKQKAIERDIPERQTAIHRLSELASMGIFEKENEKLLFHILGVDKANQDDLDALKEIATTVTELKNEAGDKEYLNSYAYQNADRIASRLINQNKDDKSRTLKIMRVIKDTYGLMNMTLISNPFNLVENNWSGQSAILGSKGELTKQMGIDARKFSNRKLWFNVFKDVAMGGVEYGGTGDKWQHKGAATDKLNSLNFKENPVKATATAIMLPFRALLNGSDAANKAILHHNGMLLMMHRALTEQGWDKEDATNYLYESLYGDNFEAAKKQAGELIDKYGDRLGISKSTYGKERATIRWANDLVKANLNLSAESSLWHNEKPVTHDLIEAALNSSFHAAAISMGHEANNNLSKGIHAGKVIAMKEEQDLIERGKYNQAAAKGLLNMVYHDGIWRMAGGGANWVVLRAEGLGLGLRTAFGGDINSNVISYDKNGSINKKSVEQSMQDRLAATRKTTRALTGIATSAIALGAIIGYGAMKKKEEGESDNDSSFEKGMQGIKHSYTLNRLGMKAMPDVALLAYLMDTQSGEGSVAAFHGALKYTENLIGANPQFTIGGHLTTAARDLKTGTDKGYQLAAGEVGKMIGDVLAPGVPIYKPFKQIYQIGAHYISGTPIQQTFTKPHTLIQGAIMGGFTQDLINLFPEWAQDNGYGDWLFPENKSKKDNSSDSPWQSASGYENVSK